MPVNKTLSPERLNSLLQAMPPEFAALLYCSMQYDPAEGLWLLYDLSGFATDDDLRTQRAVIIPYCYKGKLMSFVVMRSDPKLVTTRANALVINDFPGVVSHPDGGYSAESEQICLSDGSTAFYDTAAHVQITKPIAPLPGLVRSLSPTTWALREGAYQAESNSIYATDQNHLPYLATDREDNPLVMAYKMGRNPGNQLMYKSDVCIVSLLRSGNETRSISEMVRLFSEALDLSTAESDALFTAFLRWFSDVSADPNQMDRWGYIIDPAVLRKIANKVLRRDSNEIPVSEQISLEVSSTFNDRIEEVATGMAVSFNDDRHLEANTYHGVSWSNLRSHYTAWISAYSSMLQRLSNCLLCDQFDNTGSRDILLPNGFKFGIRGGNRQTLAGEFFSNYFVRTRGHYSLDHDAVRKLLREVILSCLGRAGRLTPSSFASSHNNLEMLMAVLNVQIFAGLTALMFSDPVVSQSSAAHEILSSRSGSSGTSRILKLSLRGEQIRVAHTDFDVELQYGSLVNGGSAVRIIQPRFLRYLNNSSGVVSTPSRPRNPHRLGYHSVARQNKAEGELYRCGIEIEKEDLEVLTSIDPEKLYNQTGWAVERDGSLNDEDGFEAVSPILPLDPDAIRKAIEGHKVLTAITDAKYSNRCGGHIHISKSNTRPAELFDALFGYYPLLYAMYPQRARSGKYCHAQPKDQYPHGHVQGPSKGAIRKTDHTLEIRIFPSPKNLNTLVNRIMLLKHMITNYRPDFNDVLAELMTESSELHRLLRKFYSAKRLGLRVQEAVIFAREIDRLRVRDESGIASFSKMIAGLPEEQPNLEEVI